MKAFLYYALNEFNAYFNFHIALVEIWCQNCLLVLMLLQNSQNFSEPKLPPAFDIIFWGYLYFAKIILHIIIKLSFITGNFCSDM